MRKKTVSLLIILLLCTTMMPTVSFGASKPNKVTVILATVDEYDNVTITWNTVKCDGYKVENGWYFRDDPAEPDYYEPQNSKKTSNSKANSCTIKAKRSDWADYVVRVRAFNKYKQKQYYNTKTHYWTSNKPSKKNWKGKKTRKVTKYKYGDSTWIEPVFKKSETSTDISDLDSPEGLSKEMQVKWYSQKFTEKLYNEVLNKNYEPSIPLNIIKTTPNFYNLSDLMKVYAISKSRYFVQSKNENTWQMHYDKNYMGCASDLSKLQMMKNLYNGTARGVCHDYALYEKAYLETLGIKAKYESNSTHAWIIVTAINSSGKTFNIKFDSGIDCYDIGIENFN